MSASKSRECFIYYVHTTACGAHKLIQYCNEIHISRGFSHSLDALALALILFSGWVECSIELELESSIVGQDWMPSKLQIFYIQNHHDLRGLSFLPPLLSAQLLPSIINRIPASLATTRILPLPFSLCLPPPASPSSPWSLLQHRNDKSNPKHLGRPPSQHINLTN